MTDLRILFRIMGWRAIATLLLLWVQGLFLIALFDVPALIGYPVATAYGLSTAALVAGDKLWAYVTGADLIGDAHD